MSDLEPRVAVLESEANRDREEFVDLREWTRNQFEKTNDHITSMGISVTEHVTRSNDALLSDIKILDELRVDRYREERNKVRILEDRVEKIVLDKTKLNVKIGVIWGGAVVLISTFVGAVFKWLIPLL